MALSPHLKFSILVILFLGLNACAKKTVTADRKPKKRSIAYLEEKMRSNQFDPEWFAAKMKVKSEENYFGVKNLQLNIRSRKDSIIWLSAQAVVGIKLEVGRALITPDSIKIVDKFNQRYYQEPFEYVQQFLDYPMDFNDLQHLFLGTLPGDIDFDLADNVKGGYVLSDPGMEVWLHPSDYSINKIDLYYEPAARSLKVDFLNYELIEGLPFSNKRKIVLQRPEEYAFDCEFSNVSASGKLSFPFKVPN